MPIFNFSLGLLAFSAAFILTGATQAETVFNLGNEYPATSIHANTADKFAGLVSEKTNGEIKIVTHHGGALGYKSTEQYDAVADGALDFASSSQSFWTGFDPMFNLPSLPFIAPTISDTRALYKAVRPIYEKNLEDSNQILLIATPWPASGLWGNKPLDSAEALKDLKIRTYDVSSTETLRNAGAFALQIGWSDLPAQLSTNAVEAVLTSADGGVGIQMWEHQEYFTVVNYAMPMQILHMNADVFARLSEDQQNAIMDAAADAEKFGWNSLETRSQTNFSKMRENGMTVVEEVPTEFLDFLEGAAQPFINTWLESAGEQGKETLALYEKYRSE